MVDDPNSVVACHATGNGLLDGKGFDYLVNNAGIGMYSTSSSAS